MSMGDIDLYYLMQHNASSAGLNTEFRLNVGIKQNLFGSFSLTSQLPMKLIMVMNLFDLKMIMPSIFIHINIAWM